MKEGHRRLYFEEPGRVSVRGIPLAPPATGQVRLSIEASGVSRGTEMLLYKGEFPGDVPVDETFGEQSSSLRYPLPYGYAAVGTVTSLGEGVDPTWKGRKAFAFVAHGDAANVSASELVALPSNLPADVGTLLANTETALSLIMDGAPLIGEKVLIFGQGVVGILTAMLLRRFPLAELVCVEPDPVRADIAASMLPRGSGQRFVRKADALPAGSDDFDLVYELSGHPEALDEAIGRTGFDGRVVVGSWYGTKGCSLGLGSAFHRRRIRIVSSQVSRLSPSLTGRFDKKRRMDLAVEFLTGAAETLAGMVTHRVPIEEAPALYQALANGEGLHAVIRYQGES